MSIHFQGYRPLLRVSRLRLLAIFIKSLLVFLCMRAAKPQMAVSIASLCIVLLLYSPLCSLSCALNSCVSSKAESAKSGEQPHHCHSEEPQEQSSPPQGSPSVPADDSGNCPSHVNVVAVVPSIINANIALHPDLQPVAAEPVSIIAFQFDLRRAIRAEGTAFRSPPTRAINSILRI